MRLCGNRRGIRPRSQSRAKRSRREQQSFHGWGVDFQGGGDGEQKSFLVCMVTGVTFTLPMGIMFPC
jgi:hypothetical protein